MPLAEPLNKHERQLLNWLEQPHIFVREVFGVTPDPWQDDVLMDFPNCKRQAMKACKGPGKAQPKSTLIPTPVGVARLGDLTAGDEVFTADGSITRVKKIYQRGVLETYCVTFDDGSSTLCCGEHLWKVRGRTERRHNTWSVLTTEQIIARGVREKNGQWQGRHFEIPRQEPVQYRPINLKLDSYVFGVWLGDGVRCCGRYATKPMPEIEAEIKRRGYSVSEVTDGVSTIYDIVPILRELEVLDCYSHERFVHETYKVSSIEQRRDLVCGLMDTDGGIGDDGHMEFSSTSKRLADDMVWLVRSLGGVAFIKSKIKQPYYRNPNGKIVDGRPCYRVTLCLPFNPFHVEHKRERWKDPTRAPNTIRYMTRKIDSIERASSSDCVCIEVDHPSHLYLTNDFIVTHNTAVEAWLMWNYIMTRPHPKIAATSVTSDNLRDNLWAELAKWQNKSEMLTALFEWQKERIVCKQHPETWWMSARTWSRTSTPEQQAQTLAGLHADYIMFILDESGGMPDAVMVAAEAALSSCKEGHIIQAGNPTQLEGPLYRASTVDKVNWKLYEITGDPDDPKRSSRVSAQWARQQITTYGRDNPWVLVNVFGRFPPGSLNALLGADDVAVATRRFYREFEYMHAPKVMGVDVAQYGDDSSVIATRQGLVAFPMKQYRNVDPGQGAGAVARQWLDWEADACFVDDTGGFGSGWIYALRQIGRSPIGVQFASKAHDPRYANKRAEMYFNLAEWVKDGGVLPDHPELRAALTQTTYSFKGDALLLEPKEAIKAKLGYSPDHADALAMTFAEPVASRSPMARQRVQFKSDYDPYAELFAQMGQS
jgi:phage terminase large subunit